MNYQMTIRRLFMVLLLSGSLSDASAQTDSTLRRFRDDLLDQLVGNWKVFSNAHGFQSTGRLDAAWVLNHQFMHVHLKSDEVIPWWKVQMEYDEYIGFHHGRQEYMVHGLSIEGDYDPSDGIAIGSRKGNEFKTVAVAGKDSSIIQRMTWLPNKKEWTIQSNLMVAGREEAVFLEMRLVAIKP